MSFGDLRGQPAHQPQPQPQPHQPQPQPTWTTRQPPPGPRPGPARGPARRAGFDPADMATEPAPGARHSTPVPGRVPTPPPAARTSGLESVGTTGHQERVAARPPAAPRQPPRRFGEEWGEIAPPRPAPQPGSAPRPRHHRRRPLSTVCKALLVCTMLVVGVSVGRALALPGDQDILSRLAGWARDNHLSVVVDTVQDLR
ncbi:hypothetical protein [Parafrankia colletiae]|uniref:hypothetical protein n=1 Tax=Parafrankia colletiae TaxID=573497 RepID=UPI000B1320C3|nr:hypothetical protein [Parafrankia colletiae]